MHLKSLGTGSASSDLRFTEPSMLAGNFELYLWFLLFVDIVGDLKLDSGVG